MPQRYTKDIFIAKAQEVHGNKYDYFQVAYQNSSTKVTIICPEHGAFQQTPQMHLKGQGCPTCAGNIADTTESFIKKAEKVHGERYDYSQTIYERSQKPVTIICRLHGPFKQKPNGHLLGQGCPVCGGTKKKSQTEFLREARTVHGYRYDYSKVEYINDKTKVCIICPEHGEFWQRPNAHLKGCGCPKCRNEQIRKRITLPVEDFLERARQVHGDKYDYSKVEYTNTRTKVCIICPEHGEFWQSPSSHISQKCGCPTCGKAVKAEKRKKYDIFPIEEARKVHGDRYNYSKVEYVNLNTKVCIICPKHGEFWQKPMEHLAGKKCLQCSIEDNTKRLRARCLKGTAMDPFNEEAIADARNALFIERARSVHGDKYDYSQVDYKSISGKVCIICPEHGEFYQSAGNHFNGAGCPKCMERYSPTTEEFIEKAIKVHGDKYDYSKAEYKNSKTKICIICPTHGEFWKTPNAHLLGGGCPICAPNHKLDTASFIIKAKERHGEKYDYSQVDYVSSTIPVTIICREHGPFKQTPSSHLSGYNCPKCSRKYMDTDFFKEVASMKHDNKYDYSLVEYKGAHEYVSIICPVHGVYKQLAYMHLFGNGCPQCNDSHLERDIARILKQKKITYEAQKSFDWLADEGPMYLDFFLPEQSIAIECQGLQHFKPLKFFGGQEGFERLTWRDSVKKIQCEQHGIQVLYYSDLGIDYPYPVIEDPAILLKVVNDISLATESWLYSYPELPLDFS